MWLHWTPESWRGPFPFEIGLFYFLTLTGFLITRTLLREREAGEHTGHPWRWRAYHGFQKRRLLRILAPCYAAMLLAVLVGAPDICSHPIAYFGHYSNFHIAMLHGWPSGTAHYWTLAIQMQFYLIWPLVVFLIPRRAMAVAFTICAALGPVSRYVVSHWFPEVIHTSMISTSALDYFGIGALLAYALWCGMPAGDKRLATVAWLALAGYVVLYVCNIRGLSTGCVGYIQQTLLTVSLAGLISWALAGHRGVVGRVLNHPAVQHVGRVSYGLYLFHTPVPLLLGIVLPWLWLPVFDGPLVVVRLVVFILVSWGAAWLCWRWLEGPNRLRWLHL